jgi:parallel beta-helix repeat protein
MPLRPTALMAALLFTAQTAFANTNDDPPGGALVVTEFLPAEYVMDGTVSYQAELQAALDVAAESSRNVVFPPMVYRLDNAQGLRISSGVTLWMRGARFELSPEIREDGQAFQGEAVEDVCFVGGTVTGRNADWPSGTNVRGIYLTGESSGIRIDGMTFRDLSSNGVGVFGVDEEHVARDVWVVDTVIDNCCNVYGDYQAPAGELHGPEHGSKREDQGLVTLYYVDGFVVRGCRFEDSRSDATHFYRCRNGRFIDNYVLRAKMGGYFVESCEHVLATNNIIRDNGSRGVTIERGSRACTLIGNTVEGSGRDGLWMPDSSHCIAMDNLFLRNGRKDNGAERHQIWDANVTINESRGDPSDSPAENCVVSHNVFDTGDDQVAAIRVDTIDSVRGIVIEDNVLLGENTKILVEGVFPERVTVSSNQRVEN